MGHVYKNIPIDNKEFVDKFNKKVEIKKTSKCIEWLHGKTTAGYGSMRFGKLQYLAHRVSFALHKKEKLINGLVVDHVCKNRACVNPNHLRQLGIVENATLGMTKKLLINARAGRVSLPTLLFQGVCKHGHEINSFSQLIPYSQKSKTLMYVCKQCNHSARL